MYKETTYLAGAMDMVPDAGSDWRRMLTPRLKKLGIVVQDPIVMTNELMGTSSSDEAKDELERLYRKNREKYFRVVAKIKRQDKAAVRRSEFIITYWGYYIPTYGTVVENDISADRKIPIYCVCFGPENSLPSWFREDIHRSGGQKFDDFNGLIKFLIQRKNIIERCHKTVPTC